MCFEKQWKWWKLSLKSVWWDTKSPSAIKGAGISWNVNQLISSVSVLIGVSENLSITWMCAIPHWGGWIVSKISVFGQNQTFLGQKNINFGQNNFVFARKYSCFAQNLAKILPKIVSFAKVFHRIFYFGQKLPK